MNLTKVNEIIYISGGFFVSGNSPSTEINQTLYVDNTYVNITHYILLLRRGCWNTVQDF